MSYYQKIIAAICKEHGIGADPRHIEGFMLLQYGSLSHLDRSTVVEECKLFATAQKIDDTDWEDCAKSYGL